MKTCVKCKHYRPDCGLMHGCIHPECVNPVTGNHADCEELRNIGSCGHEGKHWEAIDVEEV